MSSKSSATIADVAREAGVSTATVSRLINGIGPISEDTEKRVRAVITDLKYTPKRKRRSQAGRDGAGSLSPASQAPLAFLRIGPFQTNDRHPVTESLVEALHRSAHAIGRTLTVHHVPDLEKASAKEILGQAEGVLLRSSNEAEMVNQSLQWLGGLPAVQVLGENRASRLVLDHVSPDNAQAGILAAEYLLEAGCTQLVFAATSLYCGVGLDRCVAFVKTATDAGVDVHVNVQTMQGSERFFQEELAGRNVHCTVAEKRVDLLKNIAAVNGGNFGLFVPTDLELAMVVPQLQMMGIDFASNSRAIGCDREVRCFAGLDPYPATLDLHLDNIAARAIHRLTQRIGHPNEPLVRITVAPDIVKPEDLTSAPAPFASLPEGAGLD